LKTLKEKTSEGGPEVNQHPHQCIMKDGWVSGDENSSLLGSKLTMLVNPVTFLTTYQLASRLLLVGR
jgi:hypothetical protein